jgi:hypothetical protein
MKSIDNNMEIRSIIREIKELSLAERFFIVEQTLESIKKEELKQLTEFSDKKLNDYSVNEKSLAEEWLSEEDQRWDNLL